MSVLLPVGPVRNRLLQREVEQRREGLVAYLPVNPKARAFHVSDALVRCIFGANRSGKSHTGFADDVAFCEGTHPLQKAGRRPMPPIYGRIVATDYPNGIEKIAIPKLQELVTPEKLRGGSWERAYSVRKNVLYFNNGSTIDLMSNEQDLNKFDGVKRHFIHYDEEPLEEVRIRNLKRLIDFGGWEVLTMTPESGCTWVYDTFKLPLDMGNPEGRSLACWTMSIYENPHIDRQHIEQLEREIVDPEQRKISLGGEFVHRSGLVFGSQYFQNRAPWVYNHFKIPKEWTHYVGIDTHTRQKQAVVFMAVSPSGEKWVYDEIFTNNRLMSQLTDMIRAKLKGIEPYGYYIDWSSKGQDAEYGVSYYDDLVANGIPVTLALKDPAMRLQKWWQALDWDPALKPDHPVPYNADAFPCQPKGGPHLHICKQTCPTLIWEMLHYVWDDFTNRKTAERRDQPDRARKKNDHCIDAGGYVLMENPKFTEGSRSPEGEDHYPRHDHVTAQDAGAGDWWSSDYGTKGWRAFG